MVHYRYSRWDGSQEGEFDSQKLMDQLTEQILEGDSLQSALRRMMDRGMTRPDGRRGMGMRDLMQRLQEARQRNLDRYDLSSMMDDIEKQLDEIVATERSGIRGRLDELGPRDTGAPGDSDGDGDGQGQTPQQGGRPSASGAPGKGEGSPGQAMEDLLRKMAERHFEQLDGMPHDVGGRITQLRDYDFMDPEARQKFEELLETLQKQVLQNLFQGLQQGLENMTEDDLREIQHMVKDLNELAQRRLNGEDPDISGFMAKWGHLFPPGIENFDQLAEHMQHQMAQMQSLIDSMSPDQRDQLQQMMDALLRDNRLQWDLYELAFNLQRLNPDEHQGMRFSLHGDEPLTLQEALRLMGDLNDMEGMEDDLRDALRRNDPSDLDAEAMGRLLGEEAKQYANELKRMMKELEEAGFIKRGEHGFELTPKAIRRIGERALEAIFRQIRGGQMGDHEREKTGIGVELMDETKRWTFGDPFHLNTLKTVSNAVIRQGPGTPVHMIPEDFEINHTTSLTQCSTVIAIDMSASMMYTGYFQAAQRVSLALDTLIKTKYPKDNVTVLAFSYFVLPIDSTMLLDSYWVEYGGGTNFQEVLRYARQHLKKQGGTTKQIIMITDGEPTTYNRTERESWTDYPEPTNIMDDPEEFMWRRRRGGGSVVAETLREVQRCTRDNITINTFMLDRDPALLSFVKSMAKLNRGRAFVASPDELGTYVVADYFSMRNSVIR